MLKSFVGKDYQARLDLSWLNNPVPMWETLIVDTGRLCKIFVSDLLVRHLR